MGTLWERQDALAAPGEDLCRCQNRSPWKVPFKLSLKNERSELGKEEVETEVKVWRFDRETHLTRKSWNHSDLVSRVKAFRLFPKGKRKLWRGFKQGVMWSVSFQEYYLERNKGGSCGTKMKKDGSLLGSTWWEKTTSSKTIKLFLFDFFLALCEWVGLESLFVSLSQTALQLWKHLS